MEFEASIFAPVVVLGFDFNDESVLICIKVEGLIPIIYPVSDGIRSEAAATKQWARNNLPKPIFFPACVLAHDTSDDLVVQALGNLLVPFRI